MQDTSGWSVPNMDEISALPRELRLALAVRCAMRLEDLLDGPEPRSRGSLGSLQLAIDAAHVALRGEVVPEWVPDLHRVVAEQDRRAQSDLEFAASALSDGVPGLPRDSLDRVVSKLRLEACVLRTTRYILDALIEDSAVNAEFAQVATAVPFEREPLVAACCLDFAVVRKCVEHCDDEEMRLVASSIGRDDGVDDRWPFGFPFDCKSARRPRGESKPAYDSARGAFPSEVMQTIASELFKQALRSIVRFR